MSEEINNPFSERRKFPRFAKTVPVKIHCSDFDTVTETINLSCNGAYCRVNKNVEPMTTLKIHLLLPFKLENKTTTRKVSCHGVVVRSEPAPDEKTFNLAIFFNDIHQKDMDRLSDFLEFFQKGQAA